MGITRVFHRFTVSFRTAAAIRSQRKRHTTGFGWVFAISKTARLTIVSVKKTHTRTKKQYVIETDGNSAARKKRSAGRFTARANIPPGKKSVKLGTLASRKIRPENSERVSIGDRVPNESRKFVNGFSTGKPNPRDTKRVGYTECQKLKRV